MVSSPGAAPSLPPLRGRLMIGVDLFMDIHLLHRQGLSIRDIARQTALSRNTVRKVLRGQHTGQRQSSPRQDVA